MRILILLVMLLVSVRDVAAAASRPSFDISTIRALRIANNRAIAEHDVPGMRKVWATNIRLICCGNAIYTGASALAASYAQNEFKDPTFVEYVRIAQRIVVSGNGSTAQEYGRWIGVFKSPHPIHSGHYSASWKKDAGGWKIASESYVQTDSQVQDVASVLRSAVTIDVGGTPDWLVVTPDAVWAANDALRAVQRISTAREMLIASVHVPGEPCSGLADAFGSIWVPICGAHPALARIDPKTNTIAQLLPVAPALSEGGITASADSVWMVTRDGVLTRIDPTRNIVRQTISIAHGSFNPLYSNGVVWITSGGKDLVTAVDARSGRIVATVPVGSKPRFLTEGDGTIWTLDQGDGSISKIDEKHKRLIAIIPAEIPGGGGEIAFGDGALWATIIGVPLTRLDAACATPTHWFGRGGDAVRFGHDAIWITDYFNGRLFRIPKAKLRHTCSNEYM